MKLQYTLNIPKVFIYHVYLVRKSITCNRAVVLFHCEVACQYIIIRSCIVFDFNTLISFLPLNYLSIELDSTVSGTLFFLMWMLNFDR